MWANGQKILDSIDNVIQIAKQDAVKVIFANTKPRIFEQGLDKYGNKIGTYNQSFARKGSEKTYVKERKDKGLQTAYVDLVFTGQLKDSVVSNSIDKIYFKNIYGEVIGKENEKNFNRDIFAPTKDDAQVYLEIMQEELQKLFEGK